MAQLANSQGKVNAFSGIDLQLGDPPGVDEAVQFWSTCDSCCEWAVTSLKAQLWTISMQAEANSLGWKSVYVPQKIALRVEAVQMFGLWQKFSVHTWPWPSQAWIQDSSLREGHRRPWRLQLLILSQITSFWKLLLRIACKYSQVGNLTFVALLSLPLILRPNLEAWNHSSWAEHWAVWSLLTQLSETLW